MVPDDFGLVDPEVAGASPFEGDSSLGATDSLGEEGLDLLVLLSSLGDGEEISASSKSTPGKVWNLLLLSRFADFSFC